MDKIMNSSPQLLVPAILPVVEIFPIPPFPQLKQEPGKCVPAVQR